MNLRLPFFALLLAAAAPAAFAAGPPALPDLSLAGNGGGYADSGLLGEYFPNADLAGPPAFSRRDVRLKFDWAGLSPGGSAAEPFRSFPARNFSVRWTGRLLPRFSETYRLHVLAAGGVRVSLRPVGTAEFRTIIDAWQTGGKPTDASANVPLREGEPCEVRVEYRAGAAGASSLALRWSSPGTPESTVEPAGGLATNVYTEGFADAMKESRDEWKREGTDDKARRDADGWPLEDASIMVWEGTDKHEGVYGVRFNGRADCSVQFGYAQFADMSYDPARNLTTGRMIVTNKDRQNFLLHFKNSERDAKSGVNSGVTNVHLYRPVSVGGETSYAAGAIFVREYAGALARFVALRWMGGTNWNQQVVWATDRTRPDYSTQKVVLPHESGFEGNGIAWEYKVALCNETGKDLYLCLPEPANDEFITKLAQLVRYGSDGREPYPAPQASPVYPPLNSNLKVYVEYSNEVWNVGFDQWHQNFARAENAVKSGSEEGKALTFDQTDPLKLDANTRWNRSHTYQTVRASNLFRMIFGDGEMNGTEGRVRILHFWQYANSGWPPTATAEMQFLENYFNNGDGKPHVAEPHPPAYYVWGAGGATYYNGGNENGDTGLLTAGSFEAPATDDHTPLPRNAGWTFAGDAGIARTGRAFGAPATPEQLKQAKQGNMNQPAAPGETREAVNEQAAYLAAGGSFSVEVALPPGAGDVCALRFKAARKKGGHAQPFRVRVDGQEVSPARGFQPRDDWNSFETETFPAAGGSRHTIRFEAVAPDKPVDDALSFIDVVKFTSLNALYAGKVPSDGYAQRLETTSYLAQLYGLRSAGYEGGWALGGDGGGSPLQNYAKFKDARSRACNLVSTDTFYRSGGVLYTFGTYRSWTSWANAAQEPLPQGIDEANRRLPPVAGNTVALPAELTFAQSWTELGYKNLLTVEGKLDNGEKVLSWRVAAPKAGVYVFTADTTPGGTAAVIVDGVVIGAGKSGALPGEKVTLARGLHTVRVKVTDGSFTVKSVKVTAE